ncbi:MAG: YihY family inner membrane protein [Thermoanaerobaculia bacterium]
MSSRGPGSSRPASSRWRLLQFLRYLARRFWEDDCPASAAHLAYSTLLALVPLTAVALSLLAVSPVFQEASETLQAFVFRHFVPASGEVVRRWVVEFAAQAAKLPIFGLLGLVVTGLLLMTQVERALNRIWRVPASRSWRRRLTGYWAIVTAGPLLIASLLVISSQLVSLPGMSALLRWAAPAAALVALAPAALTFVAVCLTYWLAPNTSVPWRPVVAGALVATVLIEITKTGFAAYIGHYTSYRAIYGAMAAVPVFLVWLYVAWLWVLLGASFAAAVATFRPVAHLSGFRPDQQFLLLFRLVGHLWRAKREDRGLSFDDFLALEPAATGEQLETLLHALDAQRIVRESQGEWILSKDSDRVTLLDLYRTDVVRWPSAQSVAPADDRWDSALQGLLDGVEAPLEQALAVPLSTLYDVSEAATATTP